MARRRAGTVCGAPPPPRRVDVIVSDRHAAASCDGCKTQSLADIGQRLTGSAFSRPVDGVGELPLGGRTSGGSGVTAGGGGCSLRYQ